MKLVLGKFIADAPSPQPLSWLKTASQTTDAYLAQLAKVNNLKLATFDASIPGAFVIP